MKELRRKRSAPLTTRLTSLEASPHRAHASLTAVRGEEYQKREVERLQAKAEELQQQEEHQQTREQLREALRRYEELYHFAPISLISLDKAGMILDLNEQAGRLLAFPIEWLRQRPFVVFVARQDVSRFLNFLARLRQVPATETAALELFINDRVVPVQLSIGSSLRGRDVIYRLAILDLSETKAIENQLKETLNNWFSLVENAPDTIMTVDRKARITFCNRPLWGYSTRALAGTTLTDFVSEIDRVKMEKCVAVAFDPGHSSTCEVKGANGDKERWYSFSFGPVQSHFKHAPTTTVTIRDITKHKRTEESLRASREQLNKKIKSMIAEVDQTIQKVRQIVTELRPSILDELGLSAAIEWQLSEFQERTGIRGIFESSSEALNLSRDVGAALFRVVQEGLTNVMRHAGATEVRIGIKSAKDVLSILIIDNGKGITRQQISNPKSFGIVGMKERVHRVGGQLNIYSSPGRGTRIEISTPLQ